MSSGDRQPGTDRSRGADPGNRMRGTTRARPAGATVRVVLVVLVLVLGGVCVSVAWTVSTAGPVPAATLDGEAGRAAVRPPADPPAPTVAGIDVSKWQPSINWRLVDAAGHRFAYVSVVGSTGENPHFQQQWDGAGAAGLYRGAYYFGDPTTGSGQAHADQLLRRLGNVRDGRTLPPMLDVERHPNQVACDGVGPDVWIRYVSSFVTEVRARLGVSPVIYTARSFWQDCLGDTAAFARDTVLFTAQWEVAVPDVFGGWPQVTFWQHSSFGQVPGIAGNTDLDVFRGTPAQLQALTVPAR